MIRCDGVSLAMLEQSCLAFAPPARLTLVQETVRELMRGRFPGSQLGVNSWPSLLQRQEQAVEAAEQWEIPEPPDDEDPEVITEICEELCVEHKDERCLSEQRAAMSRLFVAKLYQTLIKGSQIMDLCDWLLRFVEIPQHVDGMVRAGTPHALVKVLQSGPNDAKVTAALTLATIRGGAACGCSGGSRLS